MLNEVNDMAGQHELVAENMMAKIVKEISVLLKELKDERKKVRLKNVAFSFQHRKNQEKYSLFQFFFNFYFPSLR